MTSVNVMYEPKKTKAHKVGNYYRHETGKTFILAEVNGSNWGKYVLISLEDGVQFRNPVNHISNIFDGFREEFTLIKSLDITAEGDE